MYLSIIIPAYNSEKTIVPLLDSIKRSQKIDLREIEVIVVDDCSRDATAEVSLTFLRTSGSGETFFGDAKPPYMNFVSNTSSSLNESLSPKQNKQSHLTKRQTFKAPQKAHPSPEILAVGSSHSLLNLKIIKLKINQGPAAARNIGVKYAKGKVVLFLDSDVILYKNTLFEILRSFRDDPDLYAMTGVWDKKQKSKKFFPKFKALRDWSYWINERDPKNYYYLFSTRVAAIKRDLFLRLGGFDTTYKHALVEDIELTYRIAKRYAVVFNQKAIVAHEFEDFWPILKKYFWRSFYWSKIYRERKKFDPVATTGKEAVTAISAGGVVFLSAGLLLSSLGNLSDLSRIMLIGLIVVGMIHLLGVRKFLWFVACEKGVVFALKSFFVGIVLYIAILLGAVVSFLRK